MLTAVVVDEASGHAARQHDHIEVVNSVSMLKGSLRPAGGERPMSQQDWVIEVLQGRLLGAV